MSQFVQACLLTKKKQVDLTVGASGNLSERSPKTKSVRKINKGQEDSVKHLQSVLCTDAITFHRKSGKTLKPVLECVFVGAHVREGSVYVSSVQTYHSGTQLSRQDCLTRTNRASV